MLNTLVIVLGSTASGKSTFIEKKYGGKEGLEHLCWDSIAEGIKNSSARTSTKGIHQSGSKVDQTIREYQADFYYPQTSAEFFKRLAAAFTETSTVVVDCPSFPSSDLMPKVIKKGYAAGYGLVVEGLWVTPETGTKRRLLDLFRYCAVDNEKGAEQLINFYRNNHWRDFLSSCQEMPSQFMQIASRADEARLYDNNGESRTRLMATWHNGRPQAQFNSAAMTAFKNLGKIEPRFADFSASCGFSRNDQGKIMHTVNLETTGLGSA